MYFHVKRPGLHSVTCWCMLVPAGACRGCAHPHACTIVGGLVRPHTAPMTRGGSAVVSPGPDEREHPERAVDDGPSAFDADALRTVTQARLSRPHVAADVVERNRLFAILDAGVAGPLTVVTGPPGAGKTVLASAWVERRTQPEAVAWLSVDGSETSPGQFWRAVLDAVQVSGKSELTALAARLLLGEHTFLPELANALDALPAPLVLILDDYHELRATEVNEQLDLLLHHAPEKLRLVIISRTDPPLSLNRLNVEGQLTEIRTPDLAFTVPEAAMMFELAGLKLSPDQVFALHERTEGWAAGLRLAALSLEGQDDNDELVRTFAGDDGSVADYFVEQVLHHVTPELRAFMLKTSVVDLITPGLVDALLDEQCDGAELLEQLERSGAFLSRVGQQQLTYRYHVMFRELLRSQLRHRMPDAFLLQHRRAAHWYAQQGFKVSAIGHSIAGEDWDLAANLIMANWLGLVITGKAAMVTEMIASLPRHSIVREPELALAAGAALLVAGEREQAGEYIRLADHSASLVRSSRRSEFSLARTVTRQYEASACGDLEGAIVASKKLLAGHGSDALGLDARERRVLALLNLGFAETWTRGRGEARATLESALALARHGDSEYLVFGALASLGLLEALSGELRRSAQLAAEAVSLGERFGWMRLPPAARATCALAICAYHWNELSEATTQLERAGLAALGSFDRPVSAAVQLMRALVALRSGDGEAAGSAIHAARQEALDWQMPPALENALASAEAEALIASGRTGEATAAMATAQAHGSSGEGELVRARLALAAGDPKDSAKLARGALTAKLDSLQPATAIELEAIAAVATHQLGDDESALGLVEEALGLADTEGYMSAFLTVGAPLRELVVRRIRMGTSHRALAGELVETMDPHADGALRGHVALVLEPLSEREKAVLRYLPTDLSKAEIAAELFVSVNTVKTHMKNIYRKLDVTDRAHAVRRARILRIG
jgi:LuxR family transcriptional regulator, maltose regulon positive regulatory protein